MDDAEVFSVGFILHIAFALYDKIVYTYRVEREFIYTEPFRKCWKAIGLGDDEQHELENILLENPRKGAVIEGLSGIRKLRIKLEGRGKSGEEE